MKKYIGFLAGFLFLSSMASADLGGFTLQPKGYCSISLENIKNYFDLGFYKDTLDTTRIKDWSPLSSLLDPLIGKRVKIKISEHWQRSLTYVATIEGTLDGYWSPDHPNKELQKDRPEKAGFKISPGDDGSITFPSYNEYVMQHLDRLQTVSRGMFYSSGKNKNFHTNAINDFTYPLATLWMSSGGGTRIEITPLE